MTPTDESKWYAMGLAFRCAGCGACCAGPEEGYVWVTDEEIALIALHLGMPEARFRKQHVRRVGRRQSLKEARPSKDCVFLVQRPGGRGCSIYSVRPVQCRTWPFWSGNIDQPVSWAIAGTRCPGINRGELVAANEIDAKANATG